MAIDLDLLLRAYRFGIFPMADSRDDQDTFWVEPKRRAILPLDKLHISQSLAKSIRQDRFTVTADTAFHQILLKCAEATQIRKETWINADIEEAFLSLHESGFAHSIECWQDGELVGGLYGLAQGRAFFGESMFSRATDASKTALVWLVARLKMGNFELLDCQFMTDHLASLGAIEISQERYLRYLESALNGRALDGGTLNDGLATAAQGLSAQVSTVASPSPSTASSSGSGSGSGAGLAGDWGALDGFLSSSGASGSDLRGASSPGKLILQSLTQTS